MLDDGAERGVRALAFSTGGGLDFWVLSDRSLDIGPLWWRGVPLAWQSAGRLPQPALHDAEARRRPRLRPQLLRLPRHLRPRPHPPAARTDIRCTAACRSRRRGFIAYGEDWERDEPVLFCEGEVTQSHSSGEHFRLRRRIEAPVGGNCLSISDTVENLATTAQRQASLYHFNIGFPVLADGVVVEHGGRRLLGPLCVPDATASREAASWAVDDAAGAECVVRTSRPDETLPSVTIAWSAATLPYLQLWHDLRPGKCVLGIEPCTSLRLAGGRSGPDPMLGPGESRRYNLRIVLGP